MTIKLSFYKESAVDATKGSEKFITQGEEGDNKVVTTPAPEPSEAIKPEHIDEHKEDGEKGDLQFPKKVGKVDFRDDGEKGDTKVGTSPAESPKLKSMVQNESIEAPAEKGEDGKLKSSTSPAASPTADLGIKTDKALANANRDDGEQGDIQSPKSFPAPDLMPKDKGAKDFMSEGEKGELKKTFSLQFYKPEVVEDGKVIEAALSELSDITDIILAKTNPTADSRITHVASEIRELKNRFAMAGIDGIIDEVSKSVESAPAKPKANKPASKPAENLHVESSFDNDVQLF